MKPHTENSVPRLQRLLPRFRKLRIGVLGDLMLDRYVWGNANRLSPEAAVPVVDYVSEQDCPGGAGNVAVNIAALGAKVEVFGVVGARKDTARRQSDGKTVADEAGAALHACLRKLGIGDRGIVADADRVTTLKTRIIARHQQIVRIDQERREPVSPQTEEKLFRLLVASLAKLDGLVLSDYDKGLLGDAFADRVLNAAHQLKVPVFVKPKTSRLYAYRGARVIVCNSKEAANYVGRTLSDEKSVEEAGRALLPHFGCAAVVITRGAQGMTIFEEISPRHLHIPATSFEVTFARVGQPGIDRGATGRQVFDVTGAGDTVLSVLSLAIAAGAPLPDAALLANTAAGVVVGKLGTASVSPEELAGALDETHS
ncbi:MAG TPA: PfkB family carbohydrate kinase [Candidatus Limnocylindrales bacterium]|nr:PfkB family carbohydrate kinase [Candidatus Limnocylindrales bacterium]